MGWQVAQPQLNDPNGPLATMRRFFEVPDNKQLLQLLGDMVSSEVFVYGDASLAQFATVFLEAYGSVQASNLVEVIRDATNPASAADRETRVERQAERSREVTRAFLTELAAHVDDLTIPNVVIGFQLSDTEPAQAQLKRLEMIARLLVQNPQLPERLKHVQSTISITSRSRSSTAAWSPGRKSPGSASKISRRNSLRSWPSSRR